MIIIRHHTGLQSNHSILVIPRTKLVDDDDEQGY